MENPYETPTVKPQRKESRRELWQRQLDCPYCQQPGVAAGTAYLAYPILKVRCTNCHRRSLVRLVGAARQRMAMVWLATIVTGISGIAFMHFVDPLDIEAKLAMWLPKFWTSLEQSVGLDGQTKIVIIAMALVVLTPLLLVLGFAIRICLRDVAYHSMLIPAEVDRDA